MARLTRRQIAMAAVILVFTSIGAVLYVIGCLYRNRMKRKTKS